MFPILIFLLGFFAVLHGANQFTQDVFQAVGLIVLGVAVMLVSLTIGRLTTDHLASNRPNPTHKS
jgi:hypothetical protein